MALVSEWATNAKLKDIGEKYILPPAARWTMAWAEVDLGLFKPLRFEG